LLFQEKSGNPETKDSTIIFKSSELNARAIMHIINVLKFVMREKIRRRCDQGPMLWSQIYAIFTNFPRKNWRFSQKPILWSIFFIN
jgi:hypothetical protein